MTKAEALVLVKEVLHAEDKDGSARLSEDLGVTSLMLLYAAIEIEKRTGVRFTGAHASDFATLDDMAAMLAERSAG